MHAKSAYIASHPGTPRGYAYIIHHLCRSSSDLRPSLTSSNQVNHPGSRMLKPSAAAQAHTKSNIASAKFQPNHMLYYRKPRTPSLFQRTSSFLAAGAARVLGDPADG